MVLVHGWRIPFFQWFTLCGHRRRLADTQREQPWLTQSLGWVCFPGWTCHVTSALNIQVHVLGWQVFYRIVLAGQELLTSNMVVWYYRCISFSFKTFLQVFSMAVMKGRIPWWSLPLNWIIGQPQFGSMALFDAHIYNHLCWLIYWLSLETYGIAS